MFVVIADGDGWKIQSGLLIYFYIDGFWAFEEIANIFSIKAEKQTKSHQHCQGPDYSRR